MGVGRARAMECFWVGWLVGVGAVDAWIGVCVCGVGVWLV